MGALTRPLFLSAVGVVAVLALAGCGGAGGVSDPTGAESGGRWEATLGGHPLELEDAGVSCEQTDDSMHLRIVHISLPDGITLLYSPASARGPGVPKTGAGIEGDTFTIDGAGTVHDPSGRSSTAAFTITVTCA